MKEKFEIRYKLERFLKNKKNRYTKEEYEEVMELKKELGWGPKKISQETKIPIDTIRNWVYRNIVPWEMKTNPIMSDSKLTL